MNRPDIKNSAELLDSVWSDGASFLSGGERVSPEVVTPEVDPRRASKGVDVPQEVKEVLKEVINRTEIPFLAAEAAEIRAAEQRAVTAAAEAKAAETAVAAKEQAAAEVLAVAEKTRVATEQAGSGLMDDDDDTRELVVDELADQSTDLHEALNLTFSGVDFGDVFDSTSNESFDGFEPQITPNG